jgi:GAF domain-containing protein
MTASPTDHHAAAERRIQELAKELSRARGELAESREQQGATANILAAISNASTDMRAVFDVILDNACRLCDSHLAGVFRFDGKLIHLEATKNWSAEALARGAGRYPMLLDSQKVSGRVVLTKNVVLVEDILADASYEHSTARAGGWRRMLGVPILRNGDAIGAIVVTWREPGPISSSQVDLLQTFADQAAIAIENTRLFEVEQASKREVQESLGYQTAISEVLGVISRSPTDVRPVFDTIVLNAVRLCSAQMGAVYRYDGKLVHLAAHHNYPRKVLEILNRMYPRPPQPDHVAGRSILSRAVVQVEDLLADPLFTRELALAGGWRSHLAVPMFRAGQPLGAILIARRSGQLRRWTD